MIKPQCAKCVPKFCKDGIIEAKKLPAFCPMKNFGSLVQKAAEKYRHPDNQLLFVSAALTEKESYDEKAAREKGMNIPIRPRIREVADFAHTINAKKIGLAFCIGLADEAARATAIFESHDLEICSAVCCCGAVDKSELGIPPDYKISDPKKFEASCNPLLQAELFNTLKTDFNVIIGLCVGHDMLFTRHSQAPVTTLVVKDRFTGHNPVITLYSRYHRHLV